MCWLAQTASTCYTETNRISGWWHIIKLALPNKIKNNEIVENRETCIGEALSVTMPCKEMRVLVALSFRVWEILAIEDCQFVDVLCTGHFAQGILRKGAFCVRGILCTGILCTGILYTDIFDYGTIVHHKFVPKGQTFNRRFYREVLQRLRGHVRRRRPEWEWSQDWLIEHKNAPAHPVVSVRNFWRLNQWLWPPILFSKLIWSFVISQWFRE